jgi:hypothetical protein
MSELHTAIETVNHYVNRCPDQLPKPITIEAFRRVVAAAVRYDDLQAIKAEAAPVKFGPCHEAAEAGPAPDPAAEITMMLDALGTMESIIANPVPCPAWHRLAQVASEIGYLTARLEGMTP